MFITEIPARLCRAAIGRLAFTSRTGRTAISWLSLTGSACRAAILGPFVTGISARLGRAAIGGLAFSSRTGRTAIGGFPFARSARWTAILRPFITGIPARLRRASIFRPFFTRIPARLCWAAIGRLAFPYWTGRTTIGRLPFAGSTRWTAILGPFFARIPARLCWAAISGLAKRSTWFSARLNPRLRFLALVPVFFAFAHAPASSFLIMLPTGRGCPNKYTLGSMALPPGI